MSGGCGECVVYLTSSERPTDIGLQMGKACYPCSSKGRGGEGGGYFYFLFLHCHSCFSFFPVPLFHLLYYLIYLFSPFLWETTQNDLQGQDDVSLNPNTINHFFSNLQHQALAKKYDAILSGRNPVSILYKSIAGRYWPVRVADGPITARYRFIIKNACWEVSTGK